MHVAVWVLGGEEFSAPGGWVPPPNSGDEGQGRPRWALSEIAGLFPRGLEVKTRSLEFIMNVETTGRFKRSCCSEMG